MGGEHKGAFWELPMFYVLCLNVLCHVLGGDSTGIDICRSLLSCILKMSTLTVPKLYLNGKISSKILLSLMFIISPPISIFVRGNWTDLNGGVW